MFAVIHYVIAAVLGLAMVLEVYGAISLKKLIGQGEFGGIIVLIGIYLMSKLLLIGVHSGIGEKSDNPELRGTDVASVIRHICRSYEYQSDGTMP